MTAMFPIPAPQPHLAHLRADVRAFLKTVEIKFTPQPDAWTNGADTGFTRALAKRGWIGMTWPTAYGGAGLSPLERFVVTEELLAAGAPVAAHWIADRQSGAQILRYGSDAQKHEILPKIVSGHCFFAIGMSEPNAGSDLAAVKTRAVRTANGWQLTGRKIWSSGAHLAHYMIVLARTSPIEGKNRHAGLSQFLVPLDAPGIDISPIEDMAGGTHFNEVAFADVALPADAILGQEGDGWMQCTSELGLERSGPERFMSMVTILQSVLTRLDNKQVSSEAARVIGMLYARLSVLRDMSFSLAHLLNDGASPEVEAAMLKDLGNRFESDVVSGVGRLVDLCPALETPHIRALLYAAQLRSPAASLRGGTTEIMRGIVARQLGLR